MPDIICPSCKNPIYDEDALLCHYCGGSLNRSSDGALGRMRSAGGRWIWVTVVLILLGVFVLTFLR